MSTTTQPRPSVRPSPVVIRTPRDLRAYLSGYATPAPTQSPATIAALARMDAHLRMAVTGR